MLASTEIGADMVRGAAGEGLLQVWPMTLGEALPGNPMLERPSSYQGGRSEPWEILYSEGYARMLRKCGFLQSQARYYAQQASRKAKRAYKRVLGR